MIKIYLAIIPFILIFFPVFAKAQNNSDFTILVDEAARKYYQDPDLAIAFSKNLILNDKDPEHQMVYRQIMSRAYALKGDYTESVKTSLEIDISESSKKSSFSKMILSYNLANQYQNLHLFNQSERIANETIKGSEVRNNDSRIKAVVAKFYQLQAINYEAQKKYADAERFLTNSNKLLNDYGRLNTFVIENRLLKSTLLLKQNHAEQAEKVIKETLITLEKDSSNYLIAYAYEQLSCIYFTRKDYKQAVLFLNRALDKIEKLNYLPLKNKIYGGLAKNYSALNDIENYQTYNDLYVKDKFLLDSNRKEGIRNVIKLTENFESKESLYYTNKEKARSFYIALATLLIITSLIIYWVFEIFREKRLKKQVVFFEKIKNWSTNKILDSPHTNSASFTDNKESKKESAQIPHEVELRILQKLEEFEKSDLYLNRNMSLPTLSGQLETNTKYLSEIINKYKGKNFKMYINELRINHIAHLLNTNPTFLNYKVSYLAEYAGFTSHSTFTIVFKTVTGMSPQTFINQINKSKEK